MNDKLEFETYLNISLNKYEIYLRDVRNFNNIYKDEFIITNVNESVNYSSLKQFLDNNIFKIEKLIGKFVKNIFLIIENKEIFNLHIGIKKIITFLLIKIILKILLPKLKIYLKKIIEIKKLSI